jgi:hypothetical protein
MCSSVHIHPFNKRKRSAKKAAAHIQLPNHFFRRQMIKKNAEDSRAHREINRPTLI